MANLQVAPELALPLDAVTETFAIIAKRRVGKSNAAVVLAEQMYDAGIPWVAIDPKGDWWGVRSSADGNQPGLSVVVFGGKHGDLALSPDAGAYMADLIAQERVTCVLDVSQFTKGEQIRFLYAFATRLLAVNEEPLHLFFEECDDYIPQQALNFKEPDARQLSELNVVRAFSKLVRHGGFKGIGCTLITQRVALVNKNVLSQVETFVLLRTIEPRDLKEVLARVKGHDRAPEIMDSLPSLKVGEAWVYSPAFLEIVNRVDQFYRRRTFDSGRTPKMGEKRVEPKRLADVDLAAIKEAMDEFIAETRANDPEELRAQIRRLEAELARSKSATTVETVEVEKIVEVERLVVPPIVEQMVGVLSSIGDSLTDKGGELVEMATSIGSTLNRMAMQNEREARQRPPARPVQPSRPAPARAAASASAPSEVTDRIPEGEEKILRAAAQHRGATRKQLSLSTGYKKATRDAYISRLNRKGLVVIEGDSVIPSHLGSEYLGSDFEPLPTGHALQEYWLAKLPEGEAKILGELLAVYPDGMARDMLSAETGFKESTRDAYLSRLNRRELIVLERDQDPRAGDDFF